MECQKSWIFRCTFHERCWLYDVSGNIEWILGIDLIDWMVLLDNVEYYERVHMIWYSNGILWVEDLWYAFHWWYHNTTGCTQYLMIWIISTFVWCDMIWLSIIQGLHFAGKITIRRNLNKDGLIIKNIYIELLMSYYMIYLSRVRIDYRIPLVHDTAFKSVFLNFKF